MLNQVKLALEALIVSGVFLFVQFFQSLGIEFYKHPGNLSIKRDMMDPFFPGFLQIIFAFAQALCFKQY